MSSYYLDILMNIASRMYMYGLWNMNLHTSRGTTSRSTSSIKSTLIENLILHCFVTFSFASLFTHHSEYTFGWSWTSNLNFFPSSTTMRLTCDPESNKSLSFVFLTSIYIWKRLVIFFSFCCWRLLKFTSFYTDVQRIFSSMFELLSTWFLKSISMRFFFLLYFFFLYKFSSRCNLQNFSSVWTSML